ncbi:Ribosome maturation factor RimM [Trichinella spiralis]|uniref:Ribosome maturation factor RimM n=1 Tax=Trichinella spiralis TaxID=6334 RepID=A0ABR3KQY8_TRISP
MYTSSIVRAKEAPVQVDKLGSSDPISNRRPEPGDYLVFSSTTSVSNFILRSASRNCVIANRPGVGYPIQSDDR